LQPGDENETPRWGEYRVVEIRLFDRFDGPLFEPNVRNFLHMAIAGDAGKAKITDLQAFLTGATPAQQQLPEAMPEAMQEHPPAVEDSTTAPPQILPPNPFPIGTLRVVEDEDDATQDARRNARSLL
jgi:hypothetical protein